MSSIDFQNGFVCGMATKGLTRSGEYYKPLVWNDEGIYDYFYIDFKKSMEFFSIGMFTSSIIIHDSVQIDVQRIQQVTPAVYKIYCDISNKPFGITILNKKTTLLSFSGGVILPIFSVHMYIEGQEHLERLRYIYDRCNFPKLFSDIDEDMDIELAESEDIDTIAESIVLNLNFISDVTENVNISLI